MEEHTFHVTKTHLYKDIFVAFFSIFFWIIPLQIFISLSIFPTIQGFIIEYRLFFAIVSTTLLLPILKRLYSSFFHPLIRLNNNYFVYNFDNNVYPWTSIEKMEIIGSKIHFSVKNEPVFIKEKSQSITYIPEKEKLLKKIIEFSGKYDIPLAVE